MPVAALERLHHHLGVERRGALHIDDARFQQGVALHADPLFVSVMAPAKFAGAKDYFEYSSTTRLSLMSWPNSERSGAPLNVPESFFGSTSTHAGKPTFSASCSASMMRNCVFDFSTTPTASPPFSSADGISRRLPLTAIAPCVTSWRASARVEPKPIR